MNITPKKLKLLFISLLVLIVAFLWKPAIRFYYSQLGEPVFSYFDPLDHLKVVIIYNPPDDLSAAKTDSFVVKDRALLRAFENLLKEKNWFVFPGPGRAPLEINLVGMRDNASGTSGQMHISAAKEGVDYFSVTPGGLVHYSTIDPPREIPRFHYKLTPSVASFVRNEILPKYEKDGPLFFAVEAIQRDLGQEQ